MIPVKTFLLIPVTSVPVTSFSQDSFAQLFWLLTGLCGILKFYCWLGELLGASQLVVQDIIPFFVILLYEVKFCTADQCQLARVLLCLCFSPRRGAPC